MKISFYLKFAVAFVLLIATTCSSNNLTYADLALVENRDTFAQISVDDLLSYLYAKNKRMTTFDKISITQHKLQNDNVTFVELKESGMWETQLYILETDEKRIVNLIPTSVGGLDTMFDFEIVEINSTPYIAAYSASHQGNGALELIPIKSELPKYSISCIDLHFENTAQTADEHGVFSQYGYETASSVFLGGKLHASFKDIDGDGHIDIELKGIQQIYAGGDGEAAELVREYFVKQIYLFVVKSKTFVMNVNEKIILS
jgi:hypothetical protein